MSSRGAPRSGKFTSLKTGAAQPFGKAERRLKTAQLALGLISIIVPTSCCARRRMDQTLLMLVLLPLPGSKRFTHQFAGRGKLPRSHALLQNPLHGGSDGNADLFGGCGHGRIVFIPRGFCKPSPPSARSVRTHKAPRRRSGRCRRRSRYPGCRRKPGSRRPGLTGSGNR